MPYADQSDIVDRYGEAEVLRSSDRDGNGEVDSRAVQDALTDATETINAYVGRVYSVPLNPVPRLLVRLCVDIALYLLSADADALTDEKRQRYEDAIALLKDIAEGKASVGAETEPEPETSEARAECTYGDREMTRAKLGRLF